MGILSKIFQTYENSRLKKVAAHCGAGSVLDIGYAHMPNPYFNSSQRVGLDLEKPQGTTRYEEELIGDATKLEDSIGGRQFDNVVAGEFIEHVERPYDFLRSLKPYIKPGGKLVITTPNPVGWPCLVFEWFFSKKFFFTKYHTYYFPPRWVVRMLEDSGYRVDKVQGVGLWIPGVTLPFFATLSYQVIFTATPK
jgi:SAM-dependent methyltransferase